MERNAKGDLNLRRLIAAPEAPQAPKKTSQRESEQRKARLAIGSLEVSDSLIEFADQSITPSFQTSLSDLAIKMGKATTEGIRTPISLRAKLDESAGLELKGWITPFRQALQVQLDGKILDYDLSQLNPYA
ncbi:MAG: DUF748 domain-containing protein, partial [Candidatus Latescibacteria bacterium]|nr:DUF748 domain-containing protein [Candidatus Latescibacterota bacterium]NIO77424.1 DUF748 domain-containing protein [Candidatus Latescibacterota bacterium]